MTRAETSLKVLNAHMDIDSAMSNSTWCNLNKNCTVLKLHDMCHNPKCNGQKQIINRLARTRFEIKSE